MAKKQNQNKNQKKRNMQQDYEALRERDRQNRERQQQQRRQKHARIRRACVLMLAAAVLCTGGWFGGRYALEQTGWLARHRVVLETEHYRFNAAVMSYYYADCIEQYRSYAAANPDQPMFDESKPLDKQEYSTGYTWAQMFRETCKRTVTSKLQLCEAAERAGFTLPEADRETLTAQADAYDLSKLPGYVTREDVLSALLCNALANRYQQDGMSRVDVSAEEIAARYEQDPAAYQTVSILSYHLGWDVQAVLNGDESEMDAALEHAKALAACTTPTAYRSYVQDYLAGEKQQSAAEVQNVLDTLLVTHTVSSFDPELREWLTTAQPGETTILEGERQAYAQVCMMVEPPRQDESPTADFRVILLRASNYDDDTEAMLAMANELKSRVDTDDDPVSRFRTLAQDYSSDSTTRGAGGLVRGYAKDRTTYGSDLTDWLFAAARQPGDTAVIERPSAALIVRYEGANALPAWQSAVSNALRSEKIAALEQAVKDTTVSVSEEDLKYIK